jgi:NAD(P)-dependent dehydrogenase (short-subunit alcohol dehydrogenase family)
MATQATYPNRFEGKVAVVTGGGSGMGEATAIRLAGDGAAVVIADLNVAGGERVSERIVANGVVPCSIGRMSLSLTQPPEWSAVRQPPPRLADLLHAIRVRADVPLAVRDLLTRLAVAGSDAVRRRRR